MGDRKTTRPRRPLEVRKLTLRVLGHDDLEQVVGGGEFMVRVKEQRVHSGRCLG